MNAVTYDGSRHFVQQKGDSMKRLASGIALIPSLRVPAQDRPKSVEKTFTDIAKLQQHEGPGDQPGYV